MDEETDAPQSSNIELRAETRLFICWFPGSLFNHHLPRKKK